MRITQLDEYDDFIDQFVKYPKAGQQHIEALTYCALGLTGEAGEYSEKVKKFLRDGTFDKEAAALELGDVLWYVTRSANELGFSLEYIANKNIEKLMSRKERGVLGGSGDNR